MCACSGTQLCPALCNLMDCSPPGSSVHRIFQASLLQRVAISSSGGSSQPRDQMHVCISRSLSAAAPGNRPLIPGFFCVASCFQGSSMLGQKSILHYFLWWNNNTPLYEYTVFSLSIYQTVDCFHVLAVINNAALHICV